MIWYDLICFVISCITLWNLLERCKKVDKNEQQIKTSKNHVKNQWKSKKSKSSSACGTHHPARKSIFSLFSKHFPDLFRIFSGPFPNIFRTFSGHFPNIFQIFSGHFRSTFFFHGFNFLLKFQSESFPNPLIYIYKYTVPSN